MANPNGAKGSLYERQLVEWFRGQGYEAERLRTAGNKDEGDLWVRTTDGVVHLFEAKATQRMNLPAALSELAVELPRFEANRKLAVDSVDGWAVFKRRNHPIGKSYLVVELGSYFGRTISS